MGMFRVESSHAAGPLHVARHRAWGRGSLIEQANYTIIANVGDQPSDLSGGYAEGRFLSNPFSKEFNNQKNYISQKKKIRGAESIEQANYTIIANVGDQPSDLSGGYAEGRFCRTRSTGFRDPQSNSIRRVNSVVRSVPVAMPNTG